MSDAGMQEVAAASDRRRSPSDGLSIGLAALWSLAVLLAALAASCWWAERTQQRHAQQFVTDSSQSTASILAGAARPLLTAADLSALRQLVAQAGQRDDVSMCRVVLPDGSIVAASEPAAINAVGLPDPWPAGSVAERPIVTVEGGRISAIAPLTLADGRAAEVHFERQAAGPSAPASDTLAGFGLIGAAAAGLTLIGFRFLRRRLRAVAAIREALIAIDAGPTGRDALRISADLGREAEAWNRILDQNERMRREATLKRARRSLGRRRGHSELDDACDAMPQGLILIDERMRIRYANGAAAVFLNAERPALNAVDVRTFIADPEVRRALDEWRAGGGRRRAVLESNGAAGGQGVLRWVIRPVRRDDSGSAMIVIDDVTQQRIAEEARHTFVTQATHELRTPLTNIRLYIETALDEGESDAAVRARCLNVINSESRRLERIVNDLLSTAEIEAGSLQITRDDVRLDDVFAELEADYEAQAREKQIELRFDLPPKMPVIQGDRDLLVLALHNLVGNALKYTPSGQRVTVRVNADAEDLVVEVIDTGLGISPDDQEQIFEKFYRAKDRRIDGIAGSGLGLALAREVVRLHGGDITVDSEIEKGSTFRLSIPGLDEAA